MPTILRIRGYRFFFFSLEGHEPAHIHVEQAERYAKLWLNPVMLVWEDGFRSNEICEIIKIVRDNRQMFQERWNEYFNR